jgi:hypothetical protein
MLTTAISASHSDGAGIKGCAEIPAAKPSGTRYFAAGKPAAPSLAKVSWRSKASTIQAGSPRALIEPASLAVKGAVE